MPKKSPGEIICILILIVCAFLFLLPFAGGLFMSAGGISQSVKSQSNLKGDNVVQVVGTIIDYDLTYNYDRNTGKTYHRCGAQ